MWLAAHYYEKSGDMAWLDEDFHRAMRRVVDVFETEQRHDARSPYYFLRRNCPPQDTLSHFGHGAPTAYTGMTWSGFRPSDDACVYGYLVPANYFAARALKDIALFAVLLEDGELSRRAKRLRAQILTGLECYARVEHPQFGTMLAYETDGQGRHVLMDDASPACCRPTWAMAADVYRPPLRAEPEEPFTPRAASPAAWLPHAQGLRIYRCASR